MLAQGDWREYSVAQIGMELSQSDRRPNNRMESDEVRRADAPHLAPHV